MSAYIIHFDLDSFVAQAETTGVGDEPIYLTHLVETRDTQGIPSSVVSVLIATYQDSGKNVHAARIVVERASLLGEQRRVVACVRERAAIALDVLEARLSLPAQRYAVMLAPGLYEDLKRFETDHNLWRWEGDLREPTARRLVSNDERR